MSIIGVAVFLSFMIPTYSQSAIYGHYGGKCVNACLTRGYDYAYCATTKYSWEYCSPVDGITSYGHVCNKDSPCDRHGSSFTWCYTDHSWDYCSLYGKDESWGRHITISGYYCINECMRHGSSFSCDYTYSGSNYSDYCSPLRNYDKYGRKCNEGHYCGKHGSRYNWCYVGAGSWEHCGLIKDYGYFPTLNRSDNAAHEIFHAQNESKYPGLLAIGFQSPISQQPQICELQDFELVEESDSSRRPPVNKKLRREAVNLLESFDVDRFDTMGKRTLCRNEHLIIEQRRTYVNNNQRWVVLHMQINGQTHQMVASVHVQFATTIPIDFVRQAFLHSLGTNIRVRIRRRNVERCT